MGTPPRQEKRASGMAIRAGCQENPPPHTARFHRHHRQGCFSNPAKTKMRSESVGCSGIGRMTNCKTKGVSPAGRRSEMGYRFVKTLKPESIAQTSDRINAPTVRPPLLHLVIRIWDFIRGFGDSGTRGFGDPEIQHLSIPRLQPLNYANARSPRSTLPDSPRPSPLCAPPRRLAARRIVAL